MHFDQALANIYLQLASTIVAETFKAVSEREIVHGELVITLVELLMVVMKVIIRMIMMIIRMIMVVMIIIMMMMRPILKISIFWDILYVLLSHLVCSWRI